MNALEQEIINIADLLAGTIGTLAASKNPAYAPLISLGTSLIDQVNTVVNPQNAAATHNLIGDAASAVQPVTTAIKTVGNGAATAIQKSSALQDVVGSLIKIGEDIFPFFHSKPPAAPSSPA